MTYEEALTYIHSIDWRGSRPGLSRVTELLHRLGNPQDSLKFIHVGGTNGKGSFCSMLSSVLTENGYKTGLFTSPYIENFNERMMINGCEIPNGELAELTDKVAKIADTMNDPPTEFELICALAMLYFKQNGCDIVVLEVGLGGRLDATNIIKNPILSVVTGIALDHTAILGDTVEKIATEKAGIIKEGCPVLLGCATAENDRENVESVIASTAEKQNSPFFKTDISKLSVKEFSVNGTVFDFDNYKDVKIPLIGLYQAQNASNVLSAIDILKKFGYNVDSDAIYTGLAKTKWKARFEKLSDKPLIFFDGSHNPQGVTETVKSVKCYFGDTKPIIITGVMADKNYSVMTEKIAEIASKVFTLTPDNPRSLSANELADVYTSLGVPSHACESIQSAVEAAMRFAEEADLPILALGSLYMYGDVKKAINTEKNGI